MKNQSISKYSQSEERLNVLTHALGLILSVIAFPFLVFKTLESDYGFPSITYTVFGLSMIILYAASAFYHSAKDPKKRKQLNIFDHAAIYILIAGTYSPFTLIVLRGTLGWVLFSTTWVIAIAGIIFKIYFTGRFDKLSTISYVLMGWQIVFAINPLREQLSPDGLFYLFLGGVFYTIGAVLYSINRLSYNHTIFHVFVLLGTASHFVSIFFYV